MQNQNPFKLLYLKLVTAWKDEDTNPQIKKTRESLLEVFMNVVTSNPNMDFCALHFFTLMELKVMRLAFRPFLFKEIVLPFFTKEFFKSKCKVLILKDKNPQKRYKLTLQSDLPININDDEKGYFVYHAIDFIANHLIRKRSKIYVKSNFLKRQYQKIITGILQKLKLYKKLRMTRKMEINLRYYLRKILHTTKLNRYFRWAINVGKKFSNRYEFDYSNFYVMQETQERAIAKETKNGKY